MAEKNYDHPVLDRFCNAVPRWALATNDLSKGLVQLPRMTALSRDYIQPNAKKYCRYLVFDVDYAGAAFAHEEYNLPQPTVTLVNPENAHAHLLYELTTPVSRGERAKPKPQRWLEEIQVGMTVALGADAGFAGLISKNPMSERWSRILLNRTFELRDLAQDLPDLSKQKARVRAEYAAMGRNCAIFEDSRFFAYSMASRCGSAESLRREVECYARSINTEKLPEKEIQTISKSVANWTWAHRGNLENMKIGNAGIMEFPKICKLSAEEFEVEKKRRQQESGRWTAKKKAETTDARIVRAITHLQSHEAPLSIHAIAREAQADRHSVRRAKIRLGMTIFTL